MGKINNNSTSKIKKTIATKKNRNEKGNRATCSGVNPHSKGLFFSRSPKIFILNRLPNNTNKKDNVSTTAPTNININIIIINN